MLGIGLAYNSIKINKHMLSLLNPGAMILLKKQKYKIQVAVNEVVTMFGKFQNKCSQLQYV